MCHLWSTFDRVGLAAMRLSLAFSRFAAIAFFAKLVAYFFAWHL